MAQDAPTRRDALRLAAVAPLAAAAACRAPAAWPPPGTLVALSALPEGERVRVLRGDEPIELVRRGDVVSARSLWCTHVGCEVRWVPAHEIYSCPCHGAVFAADGRVLEGPPKAPLREITVTRWGDQIVIPPRAADDPLGPRRRTLPPAGARA
jgi:nitrite reductase/ring-hydroxylating ferredoxin subunit